MRRRRMRLAPGTALLFVALCGCESVFGIGDLPEKTNPDAGNDADAGSVDDVAPPDTRPPCDDAHLADDPASCGACYRSCLGGTCTGGKCSDALLSADFLYPVSIDVDPGVDGAIYVADYDARVVVRMSKDGSTRDTLHTEASANLLPAEVHVVGDQLYWLETAKDNGPTSTLFRVDKSTGGGLIKRITGGWTSDFVVTADAVWWIDRYNAGAGTPLLSKTALDFANLTRVVTRGSGASSVWCVAADDDPNGWAYYSGSDDDATPYGIHRVRKDGSNDELIDGRTPLSMLWRDHKIYMQAVNAAGSRDIAVMNEDGTCPPGDCPQVLATIPASDGLVGFTLDETNAYANGFDDGTILRAPLDFSAPAIAIASAIGPRALAVDARALYWTTWQKNALGEHGRVWALAK